MAVLRIWKVSLCKLDFQEGHHAHTSDFPAREILYN